MKTIIQNYLKTDVNYIISNGKWTMSSQVILSGIAFLMSIAYANLLPKEVYGNYQYVLSLAELLGALGLSGLALATIRSTAKGFDGTSKHALKLYLKYSFGIVLVALVGSFYYFLNENSLLGWSLLAIAFFLPLLNGHKLYNAHLNGQKKFKESALFALFQAVVSALIILATILVFDGPLAIILAYFITHTIITVGIFWFVQKRHVGNETVDHSVQKFSAHLSVMNILSVVGGQLDKILIFQFIGSVPLAVYMFAISPARQIQHAFKSVSSIALPKLSTNSDERLREVLPGKVLRMYVFIIPILIGYILCAPFFFEILFPNYIESVPFTQVYALIFLLLPLTFFNQALISQAKSKKLYTVRISSIVMKVFLLAVLLPQFGMWGVLAATLLGELFSQVLTTFLFLRA